MEKEKLIGAFVAWTAAIREKLEQPEQTTHIDELVKRHGRHITDAEHTKIVGRWFNWGQYVVDLGQVGIGGRDE